MEIEKQSSVKLDEKESLQLPSNFYFTFFSLSALALAAALSTTSLSIALQVRHICHCVLTSDPLAK